jgi:hypothetical protein
MSAILGNGTITFGDGSIQTTKTPTNVSAFTNDSGYTTATNMDGTYATKAAAPTYFNTYDPWGHPQTVDYNSEGINIAWYNVSGTLLSSITLNCNCNC